MAAHLGQHLDVQPRRIGRIAETELGDAPAHDVPLEPRDEHPHRFEFLLAPPRQQLLGRPNVVARARVVLVDSIAHADRGDEVGGVRHVEPLRNGYLGDLDPTHDGSSLAGQPARIRPRHPVR